MKNVDRPLSKLVDIHGDAIPMETRTVREHSAVLQATVLNETHARLRLVDGQSGAPLSGRTLWLRGAAQGRVQTNKNGVAVTERQDLFVTASFTGATNVSRGVFYGPTETQVTFSQEPFNVYQFVGESRRRVRVGCRTGGAVLAGGVPSTMTVNTWTVRQRWIEALTEQLLSEVRSR